MPQEYLEYISPDGQTYTFDTGKYRFLIGEDGMGMPPIEYITQRGPDQHGESLLAYRLNPRIVQIVLRQDNCDRYSYYTERDKLIDILRPNRFPVGMISTGILRKRRPDGKIRDLRAMVSQGPSFSVMEKEYSDIYGYTETIQFICHDPIYYGSSEKEVILSLDYTAQLSFPVEFPIIFSSDILVADFAIQYLGTWFSFPDIEICGPISSPIIRNIDTDEEIKLNYELIPGEIISISLEYGNKAISSNIAGDLMGIVDDPGDFGTFHLEPSPAVTGGNNHIYVFGENAAEGISYIKLRYYERYVG